MTTQTLEQIISIHAGKPDELLVLAEQLVDQFRAIPTAALPLMQQQLGLTATEIQSVLSFYHYPVTDAPIKCRVEVCRALSCHLKSADALLHHLCGALGALPDQVTADGSLLIAQVDCLSDCERAPAVHVNGEHVAATDLDALVKRIQAALT